MPSKEREASVDKMEKVTAVVVVSATTYELEVTWYSRAGLLPIHTLVVSLLNPIGSTRECIDRVFERRRTFVFWITLITSVASDRIVSTTVSALLDCIRS
jgi:hypothetical protein